MQMFSDRSIDHTFRFPYYHYFKSAVEPLVNQVKEMTRVCTLMNHTSSLEPLLNQVREMTRVCTLLTRKCDVLLLLTNTSSLEPLVNQVRDKGEMPLVDMPLVRP